MDTLGPHNGTPPQDNNIQKRVDKSPLKFVLSRGDTPYVSTPSSDAVNVFESIDSLVLQYKKKLGVNSAESPAQALHQQPVVEKRKLEGDFMFAQDAKALCTREGSEMLTTSDVELQPAGFTMGTGYFGRGIKSKMKERRRKQQQILEEFRPKWDSSESYIDGAAQRDIDGEGGDARKRVRFEVHSECS